jgi:SPP1 family predicted phage head-tail adaptor
MKIAPATERDLEQVAAGTVLSKATHIVTGPYHAQVTTKTRLLYNGRQFSVTGVADPEERHVELVLVCVEVVA